jgi:hypothetical protein
MAGTLVANVLNTDTGLFSTNNAYLGVAKAWVNFNGSTAAINGSFNVSSITKNGTGNYTANFSTAMPNANYTTTVNNGDLSSGGSIWCNKIISQSTSGTQVGNVTTGNSYNDVSYMSVVVFSS